MTSPAAIETTASYARRALLIAAALVTLAAPLASAQDGPIDIRRVRAADAKAAELLAEGAALSPIVAGLIRQIEQSDLYVYIETGLLREMGHRGMCAAMRIVAATPAGRFVRISINVPGVRVNLLAALAHELQHAVEVAADPTVADAEELLRCYKANGFQKPDGTCCTKEATRVTALARTEVTKAFAARSAER